jgi:hypothetical protein
MISRAKRARADRCRPDPATRRTGAAVQSSRRARRSLSSRAGRGQARLCIRFGVKAAAWLGARRVDSSARPQTILRTARALRIGSRSASSWLRAHHYMGLAGRPVDCLDRNRVRGQRSSIAWHQLRRGGTPALVADQRAFVVSPLASDRAVTNRMLAESCSRPGGPVTLSLQLSHRGCREIGPDGRAGVPCPARAVGYHGAARSGAARLPARQGVARHEQALSSSPVSRPSPATGSRSWSPQ